MHAQYVLRHKYVAIFVCSVQYFGESISDVLSNFQFKIHSMRKKFWEIDVVKKCPNTRKEVNVSVIMFSL
jgi:hypothetical protein